MVSVGRSLGELIDRDQFEVRVVQRSPRKHAACAAKAIDHNPG